MPWMIMIKLNYKKWMNFSLKVFFYKSKKLLFLASDEENDIKAAVVENEGKVGGLDSANGVADGKINEEKELSSPRSAI